jgi:hypothetical protein
LSHISCSDRRFPLRFSTCFPELYGEYLHWYRHLIERFGRDRTETLWKDAFRDYPHALVGGLLTSGWYADAEAGCDVDVKLKEHLDRFFAASTSGVSMEGARQIVETTPPVPQLRSNFPSLSAGRMSTTYEALLLLKEGFALLAQALVDSYGKAGEFIVHDILLEEIQQTGLRPLTVKEFISQRRKRFRKATEIHDMHSAGLEVEVISSSGDEIITHVQECEWARFYRERHPRVGYLLSCSCDDAAYRAMNPRLRLQRTSTLMEGGDKCDFRIFAVNGEEP